MAYITEDYVSFQTAELLKEKGMDISCFNHYVQKNNNNGTSEAVTVCTLQMAMKWLREVHNIFIEISVTIDLNGNYHYRYSILNKECKYIRKGYTDFDWDYNQAIEAAIKYCLKSLI